MGEFFIFKQTIPLNRFRLERTCLNLGLIVLALTASDGLKSHGCTQLPLPASLFGFAGPHLVSRCSFGAATDATTTSPHRQLRDHSAFMATILKYCKNLQRRACGQHGPITKDQSISSPSFKLQRLLSLSYLWSDSACLLSFPALRKVDECK